MRKVFLKRENLVVEYKKSFSVLLFMVIPFLLVSCDNLPLDLKQKEYSCLSKYDRLLVEEDNTSTEKLIVDYTELKDDLVSLTAECRKRGIVWNNDELINEIAGKIASFKEMSNNHSEYYNEETTSNGSSSYSSSKTCSWCGKSFSGAHYTHLGKMSDCYSTNSSTSIGIYCSNKCCSEARKSSCPTCR
ncbi:hypothetical protein [Flavobacterium sp. GSA192]|uniref:hypothetical protein n=1 Tax=Flavobacterium sp. GSA192 TaxID=2576304 RepID=UPI00112DC604|nr:hypothetical protein [Flavobacterium sp. GSA192]